MLEHDVAKSKRTYRYGAPAVVPFGAGLSLTEFALSFAAERGAAPPPPCVIRLGAAPSAASGCTFTVSVTNKGSLVGDEVSPPPAFE